NSYDQVCEADMEEIAFETVDGNAHTWSFSSAPDESNGIYFDGQQLLDSEIILATFDVDCSRTIETNSTFINIQFSLQKGTVSESSIQEMAQVDFSSKVSLRN